MSLKEDNGRQEGGRDGSAKTASQRKPRTDSYHQELGREQEGFYPESKREHGTTNTLTLDIECLEL